MNEVTIPPLGRPYTYTMSWKPDVTVAAVVERDGQFLLVEERVAGQLVFNQPAGHLEAGESLLEAVVRETLEETAWNFVPESVVGVYLWERQPRQQAYLRVTFTGRVTSHDPDRALDRGIKQALWLSREQILAREGRLRSPLVLKCIDDYLTGARYPLGMLNHIEASPSANTFPSVRDLAIPDFDLKPIAP